MQVILSKDIENLGNANDVVKVKPGYGRNYLIPQGFARIANKRNMANLDKIIQEQNAAAEQILAAAKAIESKLSGVLLRTAAKAGTSGKIFGSVTNVQIAEAIQAQISETIDRRTITLLEEVKELGTYAAEVKLHDQVTVKVNFEVYEDK